MTVRELARRLLRPFGIQSRQELARRLARPARHWDVVRLGGELGWTIPRWAAEVPGVAYCAGAGEDITFELALHDRGYRVVLFDPTPRAIEYVHAHAPQSGRFVFEPAGWWDEHTQLRFYSPRDPAHVSHSVVNLQKTDTFFVADVKPVWQFRDELGDGHIDLVKMDIEGAEYRVLRSLLQHGPLPRVLCVDFDQPTPIRRTLVQVLRLRAAGYSLVHVEGWDYTFVRRRARSAPTAS